jgi:hypothetical protein
MVIITWFERLSRLLQLQERSRFAIPGYAGMASDPVDAVRSASPQDFKFAKLKSLPVLNIKTRKLFLEI